MAGHLEPCAGCHQNTMWVALTETKDVGYCTHCGTEMTRVLARPRTVVPPEVSARPRGLPEADASPRRVRQIPKRR